MKKVVIGLILAIVVLGGVGFLAMQQMAAQKKTNPDKDPNFSKVDRGEIALRVVETGTVDAVKSVELKSRASGRLARLLTDEGESVTSGQLVAVIDPQETELRVQQDMAQLSGARSGVARTGIEIEQQRIALREAYRQAVSRLDVLRQELRIQPELTRSTISQAKAQLELAQKAKENLVSVLHPNQRNEMTLAVEDAKIGAETSQREYDRQKDLESRGYVAGRTVESARLQAELDRSRLNIARTNLSRLDTQQRLELGRAEDEIRSARASYDRAVAGQIQDGTKRKEYEQAVSAVETARANLLQVEALRKSREQGQATVSQLSSVLADSQRQLRETQVRAPFDGVVTKRFIEVGDLVTGLSAFTAGTSILRVEDRSVMRVRLEMNEIDVARIQENMKAQIEIDALPKQKLSGYVKRIAPASTTIASTSQQTIASTDAVVKYQVEIYLDRSIPEIRTGMSAKCTLEVFKRANTLRLPIAFVGKDDKGSYVMIPADSKDPKAKPTRKSVTIGVSTGAFIEIVEGLKEGDRVAKPQYKGPPRSGFMEMGSGDE